MLICLFIYLFISRLDLVFNSCPTSTPNKALDELLNEIDEDFYNRLKNSLSNSDGKKLGVQPGEMEQNDWDDEDDDDDEPAITTGTGYGSAYREQNLGHKLEDRSTHFLAIKVTESVSMINVETNKAIF